MPKQAELHLERQGEVLDVQFDQGLHCLPFCLHLLETYFPNVRPFFEVLVDTEFKGQ